MSLFTLHLPQTNVVGPSPLYHNLPQMLASMKITAVKINIVQRSSVERLNFIQKSNVEHIFMLYLLRLNVKPFIQKSDVEDVLPMYLPQLNVAWLNPVQKNNVERLWWPDWATPS